MSHVIPPERTLFFQRDLAQTTALRSEKSVKIYWQQDYLQLSAKKENEFRKDRECLVPDVEFETSVKSVKKLLEMT